MSFAPKTAPLSWDKVLSWSLDDVHNVGAADPPLVEVALEELKGAKFDTQAPEASDPGAVAHLFSVTQAAMEYALDMWSASDRDLVQVETQLDALRMAGGSSGLGAAAELSVLNSKISSLETTVNQLEREKLSLEEELATAKAQRSNALADLQDAQAQANSHRHELIILQEQLKETKAALETKERRVREDAANDERSKTQVRELQVTLNQLTSRLEESTAEAEKYKNELTLTQGLFAEAVDEWERVERNLQDDAGAVPEFKHRITQLEDENDRLHEAKVALTTQLASYETDDSRFMALVEEKMATVKKLLLTKENELAAKDARITSLSNKVEKLDLELRASSNEALKSQLADRDATIATLRHFVETVEEREAALQSEWASREASLDELKDLAAREHAAEFAALKDEVSSTRAALRNVEARYNEAMQELDEKTREILEAHCMIKEYEGGNPRFHMALDKIKHLKANIARQDEAYKALIAKINKVQADADFLEEENAAYRHKYGSLNSQDVTIVLTAKDRELQKQAALLSRYRLDIDELEEEVLELKACLRLQAVERGAKAYDAGLDVASSVNDLLALQRPRKSGTSLLAGAAGGDNALLLDRLEQAATRLANLESENGTLMAANESLAAQASAAKSSLAALRSAAATDLDATVKELKSQLAARDSSAPVPPGVTALLDLWDSKLDLVAHCDELDDAVTKAHDEVKAVKVQLREEKMEKEHHASLAARKDRELAALEDEVIQLKSQLRTALVSGMLDPGASFAAGSASVMAPGTPSRRTYASLVVQNPALSPPAAARLSPSRSMLSSMDPASVDELGGLMAQLLEALEANEAMHSELHASERALAELNSQFDELGAQKELLYAEHAKTLAELKTAQSAARAAERRAGDSSDLLAAARETLAQLKAPNSPNKAQLINAKRTVIELRVNEKELVRRLEAASLRADDLARDHAALLARAEDAGSWTKGYIATLKASNEFLKAENTRLLALTTASVPDYEYAQVVDRAETALAAAANATEAEAAARAALANARANAADATAALARADVLEGQLEALRKTHTKTLETVDQLKELSSAVTDGSAPQVLKRKYNMVAGLKAEVLSLRTSLDSAKAAASAAKKRADAASAALQANTALLDESEAKISELSTQLGSAQEKLLVAQSKAVGCLSRDASRALSAELEETKSRAAAAAADLATYKRLLELATTQMEQMRTTRSKLEDQSLLAAKAIDDLQASGDVAAQLGALHQANMRLKAKAVEAEQAARETRREAVVASNALIAATKDADHATRSAFELRSQLMDQSRAFQAAASEHRLALVERVPRRQLDDANAALARASQRAADKDAAVADALTKLADAEAALDATRVAANVQAELVEGYKNGSTASLVEEWASQVTALRVEQLAGERHRERVLAELASARADAAENETRLAAEQELRVKLEMQLEAAKAQAATAGHAHLANMQSKDRERDIILMAMKTSAAKLGELDPSMPASRQLDEARAQLASASAAIAEYSRMIDELDAALVGSGKQVASLRAALLDKDVALSEANAKLKARHADEAHGRALAAEAGNGEGDPATARQLALAQSSVNTLEAQLQTKDKALDELRALLASTRSQAMKQKQADDETIAALQTKVLDASDASYAKLQELVNQLNVDETRPDSRSPSHAMPPSLEALLHAKNEALNQSAAAYAQLANELESVKKMADRRASQIEELLTSHRTAMEEVRGLHASEIRSLQAELAAQRQQTAELRSALQRESSAAAAAPPSSLKHTVSALRRELADKKRAIRELRAELVKAETSAPRAELAASKVSVSVKSMVAQQTTELQAKIDGLEAAMARAASAAKANKDKAKSYHSQVRVLESKLGRLEGERATMAREMKEMATAFKARERELAAKRASMRDEIEASVRRDRSSGDADIQRVARLKQRVAEKDGVIAELRDQLTRASKRIRKLELEAKAAEEQMAAAREREAQASRSRSKSSDSRGGGGDDDPPPSREPAKRRPATRRPSSATSRPDSRSAAESAAAMAQWEANKRWQRKEAALKDKIKSSAATIDSLESQLVGLKETVTKMEREKARLAAKLRKLGGGARSEERPKSASIKSAQALHDLQAEVFGLTARLEEEALAKQGLESQVAELRLELELREARDDDAVLVGVAPSVSASGDTAEAEWHARVVELEAAKRALEKEVLEVTNEATELRFELAQKTESEPRLRERIAQLEDHVALLKASGAVIASADLSSSGTGSKASKLESVVLSQNRVIEQLKAEVASAKKAGASNVKYMALRKAHRELKGKYDELEAAYLPLKEKEELVSAAASKVKRLAAENAKLTKKVKSLTADAAALKEANIELRTQTGVLEADALAARNALESLQASAEDDTCRARALLDRQEHELHAQLEAKEAALAAAQADIASLSTVKSQLETQLARARDDIEAYQALNGGARNADALLKIEKENRALKKRVSVLNDRTSVLEKDLTASLGGEQLPSVESKATEAYDKLQHTYHAALEQMAQLERENEALRLELDAFDPNFFDELEELKYAYRSAVKKVAEYEKQMRLAQRQYGIAFSGLDDDSA
ncbi:uncharacterized protein AMSG_01681 [Thecamonas trahens ATCC 50062]|uniref:Uncharacterized protein n=1 Tax=Thecamonas trahens ATCC 50062 TaxID=461836 RepID=A0A0L0DTM6_THETB|nr:hypothetical protein AMSG_01681 [Thecamonas trahens ATCC 50062]KNC54828.1 hypothetical protein AMSG_01681 [Thecamonas trahens ATCC 50062]|eukprot:XP_013761727.1 hypothetical protein AMSG_01681 [Thecamonas trahens ATCC 50062]